MLKHIPNTLTVIRFLLIPYLAYLIFQGDYLGSMVMLTISGITDVLDGFLARKFNIITDFGKLMDPLADKATQVSILIIFVIQGIIPIWIIVVLLLKEILMIAGASFLYGKELVVSSRWYGKLSTVLFYTAIVLSFMVRYWEPHLHFLYSFDQYLYYLATISAIFSLIMYCKKFYIKGYLKKG